MHQTRTVLPNQFEPNDHYYPRVLNATLHPQVRFFFSMGNERIAERYCHLHPEANAETVRALLQRKTRYFRWGGSDLFYAADDEGRRQVVVIETNSCPSGQKSMPWHDEHLEQSGYRKLLERSFIPMTLRRTLPPGQLAVLYDKNLMEASGYAATLADLTGESVLLVPCYDGESEHIRFVDGVLEVHEGGSWIPIRACLRYVTQRPWNRIPPLTRTMIYNPIVVCLAGGRNKMLASKAYEMFNGELSRSGLCIRTPETIWDVTRAQVPFWVERLGGVAVVKVPFSNAGQGVYTIVNHEELDAFMSSEQHYERYIVQALVGNSGWSSQGRDGRLYHVGTMPDRNNNIYVADLRCMVGCEPAGFFPVAIYARRARTPLSKALESGHSSWEMLGTNLSIKESSGEWATEPQRLLLMDSRDFNKIGVGLDEIIEAYLLTVLAMLAIDRMAVELVTQKNRFRRKFFGNMNPDDGLLSELMP